MRQFTIGLIFFLLSASPATACTDFRLTAQDGTVLITRTLEFAMDLRSNLMSSPRGRVFANTASEGKPGLTWTSQYGYVFLDALDTGIAVDGMNEQGLAAEALYLPGFAQYQKVPAGKENHALPYIRFVDWVLGNFKSVDEVKSALNTVYVFSQPIPQAPSIIFPLHFNITDLSGKSIVIEYVGGRMTVYDNQIGVMTNSPTYDWQMTNLRNYVNLTPATPKPIIDSGITFAATGQGAGMLGLPGDVSPPSRFVKIAIMLKTVFPPANAVDAVNVAQHVINNVDIPLGFVRESKKIDTATTELTQWTVFKDLTHKIFYYRTYGDLSLHAVDVTKINLNANAPQLKMSIQSPQYVMNMTQQFMGSGVRH